MSYSVKDETSQDGDNMSNSSKSKWTEVKPTLKCATPSVIRRGLCMLRDKGNYTGIRKLLKLIT